MGEYPITSSKANYLPKAPLANIIALGLGFLHMNFGGTQASSL